LHLSHLSCIDKYGGSLPANTALAGFQCPNCNKSMIPPIESDTELANNVRQKLSKFLWIANQLQHYQQHQREVSQNSNHQSHSDKDTPLSKLHSVPPTKSTILPQLNTPIFKATKTSLPQNINNTTAPNNFNSNGSQGQVINSSTSNNVYSAHSTIGRPLDTPITTPTSTTNPIGPIDSFHSAQVNIPGGIKDRKGQSLSVSQQKAVMDPYPVDDEEENKYRKKSFLKLFEFMGLVTRTPPTQNSKGGPKLNFKRILLLVALISTLLVVIMLTANIGEDSEGLVRNVPKVVLADDGSNLNINQKNYRLIKR